MITFEQNIYSQQAKLVLQNEFPRLSCAAIDDVIQSSKYKFTSAFHVLSYIESHREEGDGRGQFKMLPDSIKVFLKSDRPSKTFQLTDQQLCDEIALIPHFNTKESCVNEVDKVNGSDDNKPGRSSPQRDIEGEKDHLRTSCLDDIEQRMAVMRLAERQELKADTLAREVKELKARRAAEHRASAEQVREMELRLVNEIELRRQASVQAEREAREKRQLQLLMKKEQKRHQTQQRFAEQQARFAAEQNAITIRKLKNQVKEYQARSSELAIDRNGHVHIQGRAMSGNGVVQIRNGRVVHVNIR